MMRGYPTWNVPLHVTLNAFPPQVHKSRGKEEAFALPKQIAQVETTQFSPFALTGSEDGGVNVWNTELRLFQVASLNFKEILSK